MKSLKKTALLSVIASISLAMLLSGIMHIETAFAEEYEYYEPEIICTLAVDENSDEYKSAVNGEKIFTIANGKDADIYKIINVNKEYDIRLEKEEHFLPLDATRLIDSQAFTIKPGGTYEFEVIKPVTKYNSVYSYKLYFGEADTSPIEFSPFQDGEKKNNIEINDDNWEGDLDIVEEYSREIIFAKLLAGSKPINGHNKNDSSYKWALVLKALQENIDKPYEIADNLYISNKGKTSIPNWIAENAFNAIFSEGVTVSDIPKGIVFDNDKDLYIIEDQNQFIDNVIKYSDKNVTIVDIEVDYDTLHSIVLLRVDGRNIKFEYGHTSTVGPFRFGVSRIIYQ